MDRVAILTQLVEQNPADKFARYSLAMEHANSGNFAAALEQYRALIETAPDYSAAYFHAGQALERLGRVEEAKRLYRQGIEVTTRLGEGHARDQLQAALDQLPQ